MPMHIANDADGLDVAPSGLDVDHSCRIG
jgi:hypothetical protein